MSISTVDLERLLDEPLILERVKLEEFLTVVLGTRTCALLMVPVDLPDGEELALQVESDCKEQYVRASREIDPQRKLELIRDFTKARRDAFKRIVISSSPYLALTSWIKRIGIDVFTHEVLPTTWEIYVYKGLLNRWRISRLMTMRGQLRTKGGRYNMAGISSPLLVEEFSPKYVKQIGELLGYPSCCIERFIQDRASQTTAEERAAQQILNFKAQNKQVDPFVYPLKDFFPCSPACPKAKARGESIYASISNVSTEAGERYLKIIETNCSLVEHYPDIIKRHAERLRSLRS